MQYSVSRLDYIYLGVGTIGTFGLADNCPVAATCYAPHTVEVASLPGRGGAERLTSEK